MLCLRVVVAALLAVVAVDFDFGGGRILVVAARAAGEKEATASKTKSATSEEKKAARGETAELLALGGGEIK
jgi:hypothetical protein